MKHKRLTAFCACLEQVISRRIAGEGAGIKLVLDVRTGIHQELMKPELTVSVNLQGLEENWRVIAFR